MRPYSLGPTKEIAKTGMIIMLKKMDIYQNPYIGVLAVTNERITLVPESTDEKDVEIFSKALGTDVFQSNLGSLSLLGSIAAMNSHGLILPAYVDPDELEFLGEFETAGYIDTPLNAFGNNILANDNFALVHKDYDRRTIREIEDILDVEAKTGSIAKLRTVGSLAVVTNKGLLAHPLATEKELKHLKELFKVPCDIGTANFGVGQVGACMIANSSGAVTGIHSTGIEMGRIEDALLLF